MWIKYRDLRWPPGRKVAWLHREKGTECAPQQVPVMWTGPGCAEVLHPHPNTEPGPTTMAWASRHVGTCSAFGHVAPLRSGMVGIWRHLFPSKTRTEGWTQEKGWRLPLVWYLLLWDTCLRVTGTYLKHGLQETLTLLAQPQPHAGLGEAQIRGLGGWCWQMFIFKHSSNSGECSRTISLVKIRQVPKQFPGLNLHSAQVSHAGFAVSLTKSSVVTQKSHTSISLCHQSEQRMSMKSSC